MLVRGEHGEALVGFVLAEHADQRLVVEQCLAHEAGVARGDGDAQARKPFARRLDQRQNVERTVGGDAEAPALQPAFGFERLVRLARQRHDPPGDAMELFADRGEHDPSGTPMEELDLITRLQRLHLDGDGRLGQAEPTCRRGEAALFGDRVKSSDLCEVHVVPYYQFHLWNALSV